MTMHTRWPRLAGTLVVALVAASCTSGGDDATTAPDGVVAVPTAPSTDQGEAARLRSQLEAEFDGNYLGAEADGELVEVDLVAQEATLDLVGARGTAVWTYGGMVPGPSIDLELGQTLRATLRNELPDPTSVHWHGLRVPNDMDGVPGLNQSAVGPGGSFTYEFTPPDPGTYWYHSHTLGSEQLDRGLYGSFVVRDPGESDAFDVDVVWMVDDWLLGEDAQIVGEFFDNHVAMHHGRWGELVTVNGDPATELRVRPGDLVRLRLVNASNGRWYELEMPGLDARVLAVDGQTVGRLAGLDDVTLAPGNRLDVVFEAPAVAGMYPVIDGVYGAQTPVATIVVEGERAGGSLADVALNTMIPDWRRASQLPPDVELELDFGVDEDLFARYRINGVSYPDVEPVHLEQGSFTKVRIVNRTGLLHPIHLHGQFFKVLTRNGVEVDEPWFRDTILVDSEETLEVGLVPLGTGAWLLHCHIQEHADAGMATVALVRPAGADLPEVPDLRAGHIDAPLTAAEGDMGFEDELP